MFKFLKNKKIEFKEVEKEFQVYTLYDRNLKQFYSLVVSPNFQNYLNSLCYTYERSKDNELLKVNIDNLDVYLLGYYNISNGKIDSVIEYSGNFRKLIDSYHNKNFKGGIMDGTENKKD